MTDVSAMARAANQRRCRRTAEEPVRFEPEKTDCEGTRRPARAQGAILRQLMSRHDRMTPRHLP